MNVAAHNDKMLKNTEQTSNKMKKKKWERLLLTFSSPKLKHCLKEGNGSAHFRTDGSLLQTHTPTHTLVSPCSSFITLCVCVCVCVSVVFPPDVRGHNRRHTVRLSRTDVPHCPRKPPPQVGSTSLTQAVDGGTDLECRTQLDVHGGDEVVLTQQQERLSIDFLRQELSSQFLAAWRDREDDEKKTGLEDGPGGHVAWDPRGGAAAPLLNTNLGVKR